MSALEIFEHAPIGSIIAWSDGTPRPPARHRKKLSAWKTNNSQGRLIRRQGERGVGAVSLGAYFTLSYGRNWVTGPIRRRVDLASS